ncbi:unnamed protein product [Clonostachys rhizophaga]|uniref:CDP-diglyceride hydrolase n=1 Tax=Clonostachys rhizophaga TaxID=160324 RepID=A0A9N9VY43_9HYPO|nr:unnamed protein product [Clonostachys rhizophaga]
MLPSTNFRVTVARAILLCLAFEVVIADPTLQGSAATTSSKSTATRSTATKSTASATPTICSTSEIERMDLSNCRCQEKVSGCQAGVVCEAVCGLPVTKPKDVLHCDRGCTDDQNNCEGCGIWFHSLCNCLKTPDKCPHTGTVKKDSHDSVWALITNGTNDDLITNTKIIPSIEELTAQEGNVGWDFAQSFSTDVGFHNYSATALALNSWRARTHMQIHIHLCDKNMTTYTHLSTAKELPATPGTSDYRLKQLDTDPDLYCISVPKNGAIQKFGELVDYFRRGTDCTRRVGAGIMHDKRGNTWGCATFNSAGGVAKFCSTGS